jgi:uncharacterized protein
MTNLIPIFPLGIVAFPTEIVNLHIFEPRYQQLINECYKQNIFFGIPVVIDGIMQEIGTLVQLKSIEQKYDDGEMDIKVLGLHTFKILEYIKQIPDKLYSCAIVSHDSSPTFPASNQLKQTVSDLKKLHTLLNVEKNYKKPDAEIISFDIAHHVGMSLQQEYELLCMPQELQRLVKVHKHIKEAITTLDEQAKMIARIQLNGHFRNLSLDDFDFKK